MTENPEDLHWRAVQDWNNINSKNLTPLQHIQLLEKAIHKIEQRACITLGSITLMVILDRVLDEAHKKYPVLKEAKIESQKLSLRESIKNQNQKLEDLSEALRFFLVELLRVLDRITAGILTKPLHNELLNITWNDPGAA